MFGRSNGQVQQIQRQHKALLFLGGEKFSEWPRGSKEQALNRVSSMTLQDLGRGL